MEGLVGILILVLLIRWIIISRRFKRMNRRLEELSPGRREESNEAAIQNLVERVENIERFLAGQFEALSSSTETARPEPVGAAPFHPPEVSPAVAPVPMAHLDLEAAPSIGDLPSTTAEATPPVVTPPPPAKPSPWAIWRQRVREQMAGEEWEAVIGGSWLNKIGTVVLVIGVALFLGYSLRYMGPLGRVAIGLATSLTLLLGGVRLERVQRYTLFAKPLIGGGWALLYFTAYAAHNLEATRIIQEPVWGVGLLGLIAAGMIVHSLKYRSEIVTAFAYFPGFLTVAISPITGFTLVASFILAASLVLILRKTRWYHLALFGVTATYLNHAIWLEFRMGGFARRPPLETFWLSQGMLILYWCLFAAFDFLSRPETKREEGVGVGINLANTLAFLGLSFRQIWPVFPQARYLLAGIVGVAYIVSSYFLYARKRRRLHLINAVVAASLIAIAIPLKPPATPLAKHWLGIAWMMEGTLVLFLGIFLREVVFRVQAYVLSLAALGALFSINLYGQPEPPHLLRWMTVSLAIAYFYFLYRRLPDALSGGRVLEFERSAGTACSVAGSALLVVILWKELDPVLVGLAWGFLGLILLEVGLRSNHAPIRLQGYLVSALAFGRLFLANFTAPGAFLGLSHRLISIVPIIVIFYYLVHRLAEERTAKGMLEFEEHLPQVYSFAATALLIVLARFEFGRSLTVLAWAFIGFVLFCLGTLWQARDLRFQAILIAILTFWRSWSTNFYLLGSFYGIPERIATTIPAIATLYALALLAFYCPGALAQGGEEVRPGLRARLDASPRHLLSILASLLLAILLFYEVQGNFLTVAWTVQGLGLIVTGFLIRERTFRLSGLVLFAVCLCKIFLIDLRGVETIYRIVSFIVLGIILLLVSFGYTRYRDTIKRYI